MTSKVYSKQKLITRAKGFPHSKEGKDGDFTVRDIGGKGLFLFYKHGGRWYASRFSQYLNSLSLIAI